jgi:hypothetical protein
MVEPCPHDISEQDVAAQADGLCPLCLLAEVILLKSALESIDAAAVAKRAGAVKKMQAIARAALHAHQ